MRASAPGTNPDPDPDPDPNPNSDPNSDPSPNPNINQASFRAWELPVALVKASEGWEFAPRAKMRAQITARFGAAL